MLQFHAPYRCDDDCTAVSLVNESCLPEWKINRISHVRTYGLYNVHRRAGTRQQCQNACLFNPGCVAVYWQRRNYCYMYTHLYGTGITTTGRYFVYKLVERCSITSGLLFLFILGSIACSGISITQGVMLTFSPRRRDTLDRWGPHRLHAKCHPHHGVTFGVESTKKWRWSTPPRLISPHWCIGGGVGPPKPKIVLNFGI